MYIYAAKLHSSPDDETAFASPMYFNIPNSQKNITRYTLIVTAPPRIEGHTKHSLLWENLRAGVYIIQAGSEKVKVAI